MKLSLATAIIISLAVARVEVPWGNEECGGIFADLILAGTVSNT